MGKQGPCRHCGVISTPLWRNGPPEKPVLCNACGSRWRTKGTLTNYTPLHSRAEPDELEYRLQRMKAICMKNKEAKVLKRKNYSVGVVTRVSPDTASQKGVRDAFYYNQGYLKTLDEDMSNRSSSGSVISPSESCVHLGSADASDLTGATQSIVCDSTAPSRKRTCVARAKASSVEKLTKDLYNILQEQQSHFSGYTEEDVLLECDTPVVSVEIGHGSVLMRHPSSIAREEESEASSFSVYKKPHPANEACSEFITLPHHTLNRFDNFSSAEIERKKKPGQEKEHELYKRKDQQENLDMLGNCNPSICSIELKDVLNYEEFRRHITNHEMQELLKLLPSTDTVGLPDSLKLMFESPQFKENVSAFQKLLADGIFDLSPAEVNNECNNTLKRLLLHTLTKSCWVEQYNILKDTKCGSSVGGSSDARENAAIASAQSLWMERSRDSQLQNLPGGKKAVMANNGLKAPMNKDATFFSPKSVQPPDSTSRMLDCFQFGDETSDHDLLLNIPSHSSFPQAELLLPTPGFGTQTSTGSSTYQNRVPCFQTKPH
ncbi:GATA transcription factor 26-like isoform X2 [Apium graveolens]|uniref:GATA transcription factor 26-like isoform X2 n=1 Tax=Apium graveolens TaxID=4045 RepID=UPI003D78EEF7